MDKVRNARMLSLLIVSSLAGLGCTVSNVPTSREPSATPTSGVASPTPAPPTAEPPSVTFTFDPSDPVVTRALTGLDDDYINPGAIIEHDGVLHMFANVFTSWPGPVAVSHLTSPDGRAWALASPTPALTSDDVPFAEPGIDVSTGFVMAGGTWVLVFETVEIVDPWVIGIATAPSADGPWTVRPEPILEAGPTGSFDAGGLSWPSVVATDDGFLMFYTAVDRPRGDGVIALATSPDGLRWTKHGQPVLKGEGTWEGRKVDRPRVAATPGGLAMVYAGARLTERGLAWSDDGIDWRRDGGQPVIRQSDLPVPGRAWDAALIHRGDALHYFLEVGQASGPTASTDIYLATAPLP